MRNRLSIIAVILAFAGVILITIGSITGRMRPPRAVTTGSGTTMERVR